MSDEEYKLYGDMMNLSWDNANSYDYDGTLLEVNNIIKTPANLKTGTTPGSFPPPEVLMSHALCRARPCDDARRSRSLLHMHDL